MTAMRATCRWRPDQGSACRRRPRRYPTHTSEVHDRSVGRCRCSLRCPGGREKGWRTHSRRSRPSRSREPSHRHRLASRSVQAPDEHLPPHLPRRGERARRFPLEQRRRHYRQPQPSQHTPHSSKRPWRPITIALSRRSLDLPLSRSHSDDLAIVTSRRTGSGKSEPAANPAQIDAVDAASVLQKWPAAGATLAPAAFAGLFSFPSSFLNALPETGPDASAISATQ